MRLLLILLLAGCYYPEQGPPEGWVMPPDHTAAKAAALNNQYPGEAHRITVDAPGLTVAWHSASGERISRTGTITRYSTIWISVDKHGCTWDGVSTFEDLDATFTLVDEEDPLVIHIIAPAKG